VRNTGCHPHFHGCTQSVRPSKWEDTSRHTQWLGSGNVGSSRIHCKSQLCIHVVGCMCVQKGVRVKRTATWSAAAWQPLLLCYRPTVFFRRYNLTLLSFPQGNIRRGFQNCYFSYFFLKSELVWDCITWNCASLVVSVPGLYLEQVTGYDSFVRKLCSEMSFASYPTTDVM
jgi:hypothetical protein